MKAKITVALLALMLLVFVPNVVSAAPHETGGSLVTAIQQSVGAGNTFTGNLTVTGFQVVNGVINAVGNITGNLTNSSGAIIGTLTKAPLSIPLTGLTGTCTILTLNTGAINLNLLGLNVALAPINLVITAEAGPGKLLGNLLCAVVHLLDGNAAPTAISNLLNQVVGAIGL